MKAGCLKREFRDPLHYLIVLYLLSIITGPKMPSQSALPVAEVRMLKDMGSGGLYDNTSSKRKEMRLEV